MSLAPEQLALVVFVGMVACVMVGYYLGYDWGKKQRPSMSKSAAARIMARASWRNRR